jgi:hypothetical protein
MKDMKMKTVVATLLGLCGTACCVFGQGAILWDESVYGQLSEDSGHPTVLNAFQLGTNSVIGSTEVVPTPPNWAGHPNIFTIQVPSTLSLNAVYLHMDKPNVWAWIGDPGFSTEMAFVMNPSSGELLAQWGLSSIGPGVYGMYLENVDQQPITSIANFRLDFFMQGIPEPNSLSLFLVGVGLVGFRGWRRRSQTHQR